MSAPAGLQDPGVANAYPAAAFCPHDDLNCRLPFSSAIHLSHNFASRRHRGTKPRKLFNVNCVLTLQSHVGGTPRSRSCSTCCVPELT